MFSGIIEKKGCVARLTGKAAGARLALEHDGWRPHDRKIACGDSICINGVCLTVVRCDEQTIEFDVIAETLQKSTLGVLDIGQYVNMEASLSASTLISGHFVQGHVEGVGTVTLIQRGDDHRVGIKPPASLMPCVIPKGSITVDGVSLTVARVRKAQFEVALIPTTLAMTTLGELQKGTKVNLETDLINRTVVHTLRQATADGGVTLELLRDAGFVGTLNH